MRSRLASLTIFIVSVLAAPLATSTLHGGDGAVFFTRSDCNADGNILAGDRCGLADAVFVLNFLFRSGTAPLCLEACNSNDDESVDIADGIFGLAFCFLGGPPPPPPSTECGLDPTPSLTCRSFPPCAGVNPSPCARQEAFGFGPCDFAFGIKWDGSRCITVSGCDCEGEDCDDLFESFEECEAAFRDCTGRCEPMDVTPVGECDAELGFLWDGSRCVSISGCECVGPDCDRLYISAQECEASNFDCDEEPSCPPMDAEGRGECALALGVVWDGRRCRSISGCECEGEDCDDLYDSIEECLDDHAPCPVNCEPMDVREVGACEPVNGFFWNGRECVLLSGCSCEGADCGRVFATIAECREVHRNCPAVEERPPR